MKMQLNGPIPPVVAPKTTIQRLKESMKGMKTKVEAELNLPENRVGFNFILK